MAKKPIFKIAVAAILNFKNFNFWSRDCHRGSISDAVHQVSTKSDNFSLRYGDLGWRGGLVVGRRTCDLVVAGSRPGREAAA